MWARPRSPNLFDSFQCGDHLLSLSPLQYRVGRQVGPSSFLQVCVCIVIYIYTRDAYAPHPGGA